MDIVAVSKPLVWWEHRTGLFVTEGLTRIYTTEGALDIPSGLRSDLSSVPNILWGVLDSTPSQLGMMGIGHDYACRSDAKVWGRWRYTQIMLEDPRPISPQFATDLAVALAAWSRASLSDQKKIRWGLTVSVDHYWHKKTVDWKGI